MGAVGRPVHNIPLRPALWHIAQWRSRSPGALNPSVSLSFDKISIRQRRVAQVDMSFAGSGARDMRALLRENELRQVNMGSSVMILCFYCCKPGEVRV